VLLAQDGFNKGGVRAVHRRRQDRRQRFGTTAQCLIEPLQEFGLEARREGRARLVDHIGNASQTQSPHQRPGSR
jgi:hypothetical protein